MDDKARIAELEAQNAELLAKVASLEAKAALLLAELSKRDLPKDSTNSHQPPSQDKYSKRVRKSLRKKSGRKSGGQKGHKGHHLKMADNPSIEHDLKSNYCGQCGHDLSSESHRLISKRQVVEIPPIQPIYIQYNQYGCSCPHCNHEQKAAYPEGVNSPIQYGKSIESLVSYLSVFQYLPYKRLKMLLRDVVGLQISEGSIANLLTRSSEKMKVVYQAIQSQIESAFYSGSDETGAKVDGEKWWIWVWQNALNTFLHISKSRGFQAIEEVFPQGLPNTIVGSDRWPAQLKMVTKHKQLCLAHLLRDLIWIGQSEKNEWAKQLQELFLEAIQLKRELLTDKAISNESRQVEELEKKLNQLLAVPLVESQVPEAAKFQKAMIKNRPYLFTFLYHPEVPFDNNGSERAIRNVKVKQKISGQFKSGQESFCIIRSVIDTLAKRGLDLMDTIQQIMNRNDYQYTWTLLQRVGI